MSTQFFFVPLMYQLKVTVDRRLKPNLSRHSQQIFPTVSWNTPLSYDKLLYTLLRKFIVDGMDGNFIHTLIDRPITLALSFLL
ncbi:hypothetical protein [cyanobacterium endosymbiont of Rhopalodia gibberula]|uniref:hypothetical protein n=1 Tax=cyanobacterium endosymbiont of Rhopalodia gibberula TaxID=1763363 RepID=UPI0011AB34D0|nr:hypothetical protein [cyanobacterium endosymbiont of Rhopalodia gibberula]